MLKKCNKILFVQNKKQSVHAVEHLYQAVAKFDGIRPLYISTQDWNNESFKKIIQDNQEVQSCILPFQAVEELTYLLDQKLPLKWVHTVGTGIDNYRPLFQRLKDNDIIMTNSKGRSALLLAEFAVLGSLYFAKNISYIYQLQQNKEWKENEKFVQLMSKKKALIVGLGSIGGEIAKKCHYGFNMKVIGIKRNINQIEDDLKPCVQNLIKLDQIQDVIKDIDYIYLSMPGVDTGEIINKELIQKMKKGVVIVNVGRGNIINEDDLAWGIKEGIIHGAALDVMQEEPLNKDSQFYNDDVLKQKVLITCHSMDYSQELAEFSVDIFEDVLKSVMNEDKNIKNTVNLDLGYQIILYYYYKCI